MINFENVEMVIVPDQDQNEEEVFNFNSPENVLIEVVKHDLEGPSDDWKNFSIENCNVIWRKDPGVTGAASYEQSYGGFLDYTIQGMIDPPGEGFFVIENVTGYYSKGDGWMTDDDMEFYYENVRSATQEEIGLM